MLEPVNPAALPTTVPVPVHVPPSRPPVPFRCCPGTGTFPGTWTDCSMQSGWMSIACRWSSRL